MDHHPHALTARDITHRAMLRSTAAMIQTRWPGRYTGDLATRLEELAEQIENGQTPQILGTPVGGVKGNPSDYHPEGDERNT